MNFQKNFDEKAKMQDLLTSEKQLAGMYGTFLCETVPGIIRTTLSGLLVEEHSIQAEVYDEMQNRGWYAPAKAEDAKVEQEKQKFAPATT